MRRILRIRAVFFLLGLLVACGGGIVGQVNPNPPGLNLVPQENVFTAASFFSDPVGSIATVGLNNPHPVQKAQAITDGNDIVLRGFGGKLFVVNRGFTSTIQMIAPETFEIVGNYSTGAGSNPQDILVANGKAYITRLDAHLAVDNKDDLWVVDPLDGTPIKTIDCKPHTADNGDRLARAQNMALVGEKLYVLLQDLSANFAADTNGKLLVLDTVTDTVLHVIPLAGRNPTDIRYESAAGLLWIAHSGVFDSHFQNDTGTPYGGLEVVDTATDTSLGMRIDDADFGGYVSLVRLVSETLGVVTVKAATIATFNPQTGAVLNKTLYKSPGSFLPDLLVDPNGLLWIPERHLGQDGLLRIDPQTGATLAGPFSVGALPASLTLIK